jgi:hypothetical protein
MADVAAMDIVIGADVQKAIAGLEHLSQELADMSKTGVTSIEQLNRAMATLREAGLKTSDLGTLAKYNQALEKLSGEATRLKNVGLGEGLKKIRPGASEATQSLTDLGRVAQDLPFGFIAIQNNLGPLFESFGRLAAESKKTGTSLLSNLGAALSGPAGIGVALSVVSAAITLFQLGFSAWTRGFGAGKKAIDDATKANEDFTKSLNDARAGAISTSMQLQNFVNIARDGSKPLEQRNEALKEANRLMGEHGEKLTLANVGTKAITDQTNLFTEALINQAVATKYADRAADLIIKQTEASREYAKALDDSNKKTKDANELNRIAGTGTGGIGGGGNIVATNNATTAYNKAVGAATNYKLITKDLNQVNTDLAATQEKVTASFGKIGEKTKETAKHTKDTADVIKELNKALEKLDFRHIIDGTDVLDDKLKAVNDTIVELLSRGLTFDSAQIKNLLVQADGIKEEIEKRLQFKITAQLDLQQTIQTVSKQSAEVREALRKDFEEGTKPLRLQAVTEFLGGVGDETLVKRRKHIAEDQKKQFENAMKAAQALQGVFTDVFNAMAEGGQSAIQVLLHSLEQLIIKLASAAAAAALISLITGGATNPISFISAFKGLLGLQHGGIITGPTAALIGEAGPEVVFPLDRLREFIQPAQSQIVVLETRVRGSDIWLSQSRTNERRDRTY